MVVTKSSRSVSGSSRMDPRICLLIAAAVVGALTTNIGRGLSSNTVTAATPTLPAASGTTFDTVAEAAANFVPEADESDGERYEVARGRR